MKRWTPELEARLRTLRAQEMTYDYIGFVMGVSKNSAISKARAMGLQKADGSNCRDYYFWTPEREAVLKAMRERGATLDEIGRYFVRTDSAICQKLRRMGVSKPPIEKRRAQPADAASDLIARRNAILHDRDHGRSVADVARRYGLDVRDVHDICRHDWTPEVGL